MNRDRRRWLAAALALGLPSLGHAQQAQVPRHKVSASELHRAMSARFPVRLDLGGLFAVQVGAPALLLAPRRNQLGATLLAQLGGPALAPVPPGEMDVVFGLRYEPRDRSLRAQGSQLLAVRWPGLPQEIVQALQGAWPDFAREALGDFVLHQFSERELALPETMGFQPQAFNVAEDGLVVVFGPKR